jgi:hypothetical protein
VSFLEILIVLLGVIYWSNAFGLRGKQTISGELMLLMLITFNRFYNILGKVIYFSISHCIRLYEVVSASDNWFASVVLTLVFCSYSVKSYIVIELYCLYCAP